MISCMPCVVAVEAWDSEMFGSRMPANATNLCDLVVLQTIDVFVLATIICRKSLLSLFLHYPYRWLA